jgi:hypothetical protein
VDHNTIRFEHSASVLGPRRCPVTPFLRRGKIQARIEGLTEMSRQAAAVLYVVAMIAVIVSVDFVFFRHQFWERLAVNIGIVLVFVAFYFRFLRHPVSTPQ